MNPIEIEAWGLRVLDTVARGGRAEDAQAECKRAWPTIHAKAARQIAGLCNAARGSGALWLVGVDETQGVVPVEHSEFADWWAQVESWFDGVPPTVTVVVLHQPEGQVVLLHFETDRAPFVVRNPRFGSSEGGPVEREVPWREGNATRSARRDDLVRLLAPLQRVPQVELLNATLDATSSAAADGAHNTTWRLEMKLYLVHPVEETVVIPFHRCTGSVTLRRWNDDSIPLLVSCSPGGVTRHLVARAPDERVRTIESGIDQLIVRGSGYVAVTGIASVSAAGPRPFYLDRHVDAVVKLLPAGVTLPIHVIAPLKLTADSGADRATWRAN